MAQTPKNEMGYDLDLISDFYLILRLRSLSCFLLSISKDNITIFCLLAKPKLDDLMIKLDNILAINGKRVERQMSLLIS